MTYQQLVQDYLDTMVVYGRDTYGEVFSPLFASTLLRNPVPVVPSGEDLLPGIVGSREGDRSPFGANLGQDSQLLQLLYRFSQVTGDFNYATAADQAISYGFNQTRSPNTNLIAWGEHLSWNFYTDKVHSNRTYGYHEFSESWPFWDRTYAVAPEATVDFALGLWQNQLHNQSSGEFNRHALYQIRGTRGGFEFPRHGGYYIETWAHTLANTSEVREQAKLLSGIDTVVNLFLDRSSISGGVPAGSGSLDNIYWSGNNLELATSLQKSAPLVPLATEATMRELWEAIDNYFLTLPHQVGDLTSPGLVTVAQFSTEDETNLVQEYTNAWESAYGSSLESELALQILDRYKLTGRTEFLDLFFQSADRYLNNPLPATQVDYSQPGWQIEGVVDFNNNGTPDLLWRNSQKRQLITWLLKENRRNNGGFLDQNVINGSFDLLGSADFSGDSRNDLLWYQKDSNVLRVWAMDGTRVRNEQSLRSDIGFKWRPAGIGNFNGDDQGDLLWYKDTENGTQLAVTFREAENLVTGPVIAKLDVTEKVIKLAQFGGDLTTDVLVYNPLEGESTIYLLNNQSLVTREIELPAISPNWTLVNTGDFNGDATTDLVWRNQINHQTAIWLLTREGTILDNDSYRNLDGDWRLVDSADFNQDGKSDILWQHKTTNETLLWSLDGLDLISEASIRNPKVDEITFYPGAFADAINLMREAYQYSGNPLYLERAQVFADQAVDLFLDESSALPKVTNVSDHYETITGGDNLMLALFELSQVS